jgi:hypothetical protein
MKNIKLTLATTLSVLALTFTGTASADGGSQYKNHKHHNGTSKLTFTKNINKHTVKNKKNNKVRNARFNKKVIKRVVVKHTPTKTVFISKRAVKKPAPGRIVSNQRYKQVKRYNQRTKYNNRYRFNNRSKYNHAKYNGSTYNSSKHSNRVTNNKRHTLYNSNGIAVSFVF